MRPQQPIAEQINVRFPLKENSGIHLIEGATT